MEGEGVGANRGISTARNPHICACCVLLTALRLHCWLESVAAAHQRMMASFFGGAELLLVAEEQQREHLQTARDVVVRGEAMHRRRYP